MIYYERKNHPPHPAKIKVDECITTLRTALRQTEHLAQYLQTASAQAQFFPANDYRRIYIEVKAHAQIGQIFPAPYSSFSQLADLLTPIVGWAVDAACLKSYFIRAKDKNHLKLDIFRRANQLK